MVTTVLAVRPIRQVRRHQLKRRNARGCAKAGLALQAHRLQRDRPVRAAEQRVGAEADAERDVGRAAGIAAGQSTRAEPMGRSEHRPMDDGRLIPADVEAGAADGAEIGLRAAGFLL